MYQDMETALFLLLWETPKNSFEEFHIPWLIIEHDAFIEWLNQFKSKYNSYTCVIWFRGGGKIFFFLKYFEMQLQRKRIERALCMI